MCDIDGVCGWRRKRSGEKRVKMELDIGYKILIMKTKTASFLPVTKKNLLMCASWYVFQGRRGQRGTTAAER